MKILINFLVLLMLTHSCDSSKKAIENNKKMQQTLSGTYHITQLGDTDVASSKFAITFDETSNKFTGFAGCNHIFGSYSVNNNAITFSNIASSKKYCGKEIMTAEDTVLKSLKSVNSFSINDTTISFLENDILLIKGSSAAIMSKKNTLEILNYDNVSVKYQALSKGSFEFTLISESEIINSTDQSLQNLNTYTIKAKDWEELLSLIEAVDLENFQELEAPSKKHRFDGAPHATLRIQMGDVEYVTPTFDHGNPNKAIEILVNKVLSIKENTKKQ